LEIFPSSFGNVSCIENAFGTVYVISLNNYSIGHKSYLVKLTVTFISKEARKF
jgi:hypothetical protein